MHLQLVRCSNNNKDFINLVNKLNAELAIIDGDEHEFYNQYNGLENIKYVIVAYRNTTPVACGAIKTFDSSSMEVKRMYTDKAARGQGLATQVLKELEQWAAELGCKSIVLETGKRQADAVALYIKNGYEVIPNFGPYVGVENSSCFRKKLSSD